jgi:hypothetical protein
MHDMDPTLAFLFYLGALVCLVWSALGDDYRPRSRSRSRRRSITVVRLLPLGLALALIPTLWTTAQAAF